MLPQDAVKGDCEVELAVLIGKAATCVSEEEAMAHVAGYCIFNDMSERELQLERGAQWTRGKSCDTFGPIGPWIVTPDEVADPHALRLTLAVNGERMQDASTNGLVFSIPQLVSKLSACFTLQTGDVIATGTPSGFGLGMEPPRYLKASDDMHFTITGLGEQRQKVTAWAK